VSWILDNPELSAGILTALVLLAALGFAYKQLKDMAKDRHAQILLALSNSWRSDVMQRARASLLKKFQEAKNMDAKDPGTKLAEMIIDYSEKEPELAVELVKIADFFEDIGLMVNKKMLHPPDLALEIFAGSIILYWEKYKIFVDNMRKEAQRTDVYEWFEYLYRLSKAYSEAKTTYKGSPETRPSAKGLFSKLSSLFK